MLGKDVIKTGTGTKCSRKLGLGKGIFAAQAARIDARKLSTSSLSWLAWLDSDCADDSTWPDAEPVSAAP
jgi:hypothetical protein